MESELNSAVEKNLPFAIYRLPYKKSAYAVIQQEQELPFYAFEDIHKLEGFLVAPFRGEKINHTLCLKPDNQFEFAISEIGKSISVNQVLRTDSKQSGSEYAMTHQEYLSRAEYLIEVLRDGQLRKIVLSRVVDHTFKEGFNVDDFLKGIMLKNTHAFVYLVNLPGFGLWAGATPEILLKMDKDHAETVALAGTQAIENFNWSEKEIKEQQIVMDYIEEVLFNLGITEYGKMGPVTVKAGNVVHLKTQYNLSKEQTENKVGELIAGLHPTPAVCGLPRNKSYELIRKVEKHERGFYSGFIGPWNLFGDSQLFVNLRCAEIYSDKLSLYVGGGLTAESKPEDEWQETVKKSQTLLSVVEKI